MFPGCKSIILIGFGGSAFWKIFQGYLESNPDFKEKHEDLIDNYTLMVFEEISHALKGSGVNHKAVFPVRRFGYGGQFFSARRSGRGRRTEPPRDTAPPRVRPLGIA